MFGLQVHSFCHPFFLPITQLIVGKARGLCHLLKCSDNSALVPHTKCEDETFKDEADTFLSCCDINYLNLNISKIKELVTELWRGGSLMVITCLVVLVFPEIQDVFLLFLQ